ncbi:MAG: hypothetical protein AAF747_11395, partial [Planctomycetota bacterium]
DGVSFDQPPPVASLSFGCELLLPGVTATEIAAPSSTLDRITGWERRHPLTRSTGLDDVRFVPSVGLEVGAGSGATVLASSTAGPAIVLTSADGVNHIATSFELAGSTWPAQFGFPIFLANALEQLPGARFAGRAESWRAGEPVPIPQPTTSLESADGSRIELTPGVRTAALQTAGVYTAEPSGSIIAINTASVRESLIDAPAQVEINGTALPPTAGDRSAQPREIWRWFVIAAGLLACIEWVIYGRTMRA